MSKQIGIRTALVMIVIIVHALTIRSKRTKTEMKLETTVITALRLAIQGKKRKKMEIELLTHAIIVQLKPIKIKEILMTILSEMPVIIVLMIQTKINWILMTMVLVMLAIYVQVETTTVILIEIGRAS